MVSIPKTNCPNRGKSIPAPIFLFDTHSRELVRVLGGAAPEKTIVSFVL
jgi:hypothetical protein